MSLGDSHHLGAQDPAPPSWWKTRSGMILCGFLLIAGFYLLAEHTAHVFGVLPYLLILPCPVMHMFMHHGHGGHGHGGHGSESSRKTDASHRDAGGAV